MVEINPLLRETGPLCINEVKTNVAVHCPGYVAFRSKTVGSADRGGTSKKLYRAFIVHDVNLSVRDQV